MKVTHLSNPHALFLMRLDWCAGETLQPYFQHNCDEQVGFEVNIKSGYCRSHAVNYPFIIEPHDFEVALVAALQHIGHAVPRSAASAGSSGPLVSGGGAA